MDYLNFPPDAVVAVGTAADPQFVKCKYSVETIKKTFARYGLVRPFAMYTGGIDHRKNIEALIQSYAKLPRNVRADHQLAIVCSVQPVEKVRLLDLAKKSGLSSDEIVMTGFVPEDDLLLL
jgi:glycosyltransferase involved in cell wall biosynthesis